MAGFPLAWGEERLGPPRDDGAPVSAEAIASYLESCAYHHLDDEPPRTFGGLTLALRQTVDQRDFWIWRCDDSTGETWFVVASDGPGSPRRWAFAESTYDRTVEVFLEDTLAEFRRPR